jgi:hypothetical protein
MVWAVDLRTNPILERWSASTMIKAKLAGTTDDRASSNRIPTRADPCNVLRQLSQPSDELFGMALSTWNQGLASWDFGIPTDYSDPA